MISTNWRLSELKSLVGKIAAERSENKSSIAPQINAIEFLGEGKEAKMLVKLADETEIELNVAPHTYLN